KITLPKVGEELSKRPADREFLQQEQQTARLRTAYETAITRLKGLVRDRRAGRTPSCFVSYAWGVDAHERFVTALVQSLITADVDVIFDRKDNAAIGKDVARFLSDGLERADFVLVIGTPEYLKKYTNKVSTTGSVVAAEVDLIHQRLTGT